MCIRDRYSGSTSISIPSIRKSIYVSSDPEIATVDENGVVTSVSYTHLDVYKRQA